MRDQLKKDRIKICGKSLVNERAASYITDGRLDVLIII